MSPDPILAFFDEAIGATFGTQRPDGAQLLDEVQAAIEKYVVLPSSHAVVAVVLWIAATHGQPAWQSAPRLGINSPEKRCGKSRLLDVIEALCYRSLMAFSATVAALFRSINDEDPPTLLFDEADAIWSAKKTGDGAEDLRALLNAGYGRGRPALRCVGPLQIPTEFPTFAMAALAGIGDCLPDTVTDRSVMITMRRRAAHESVDQFRQRRDAPPLHELRERLSSWVRANLDVLEAAEPETPVTDRAADTWEPLLAIADLAGGDWPSLARTAATVLCAASEEADHESSIGARLLTDCRDIFTVGPAPVYASEDLVRRLRQISESPWDAWDLTQRNLAHRLGVYGIKSQRVRPDGVNQVRGYRLEDFADAFARYLTGSPGEPSLSVTASQPQVSPVTDKTDVTDRSVTSLESVTGLTSTYDAVTDRDATCRACGGVMDPSALAGGFLTHPSCDSAA